MLPLTLFHNIPSSLKENFVYPPARCFSSWEEILWSYHLRHGVFNSCHVFLVIASVNISSFILDFPAFLLSLSIYVCEYSFHVNLPFFGIICASITLFKHRHLHFSTRKSSSSTLILQWQSTLLHEKGCPQGMRIQKQQQQQ